MVEHVEIVKIDELTDYGDKVKVERYEDMKI